MIANVSPDRSYPISSHPALLQLPRLLYYNSSMSAFELCRAVWGLES